MLKSAEQDIYPAYKLDFQNMLIPFFSVNIIYAPYTVLPAKRGSDIMFCL